MTSHIEGLSRRRAIIVGAGQSGLAVAASLISHGLQPQIDFAVIDASREEERTWDRRWHSLRLHTTARESALPGLSFSGDPNRHPFADEMGHYLTNFARTFAIKPIWDTPAIHVRKPGEGTTLELITSRGEVQTRNVVAASGAYARPRRPDWAYDLVVPGATLHSHDYLYPRQVPPGRVLVVGGGDAAVEIASELGLSHDVVISTRNRRIDRALRAHHTRSIALNNGDPAATGAITTRPPVINATGDTVTFSDRTQLTVGSVVFATGYLPGDAWLPDTVVPHHGRAVDTSIPGLFVAGIPGYGDPHAPRIGTVARLAQRVARRILERP
ncbi:NAD(P)/FAD-dependent oxidoreductase [Microbacterium sp. Gd 4-13]|uniref:NAD(P)-binding domain-containing protein n=1 Tax=Microbacterium sp. Gd 4-13 TaxID=2173179 RepID=UPI001057BBC3|nr:NAD(P)/FAD-dependent oxidoreductase [Microbacterium sp. Gd 4-13]